MSMALDVDSLAYAVTVFGKDSSAYMGSAVAIVAVADSFAGCTDRYNQTARQDVVPVAQKVETTVLAEIHKTHRIQVVPVVASS